MANERYLTTEAFALYVQEENNFRSRLEARLAEDHRVLRLELGEIKAFVRDTNGRVGKAEQDIAVIKNEVRAIKDEDLAIDEAVESIRSKGCNQLASHVAILNAGGDPTAATQGWSRPKKVAAGVGVTIMAWPALQEIAKAVHALVEWVGGHP